MTQGQLAWRTQAIAGAEVSRKPRAKNEGPGFEEHAHIGGKGMNGNKIKKISLGK